VILAVKPGIAPEGERERGFKKGFKKTSLPVVMSNANDWVYSPNLFLASGWVALFFLFKNKDSNGRENLLGMGAAEILTRPKPLVSTFHGPDSNMIMALLLLPTVTMARDGIQRISCYI
jgi:hypothetical protein